MPTAAQVEQFFSLLEAEKQVLERFVQLLKTEQQVLVNGGKDELPPITAAKTTLTDQLVQQGKQRSVAMSDGNIPTDRAELADWIKQQAAAHQTLWASFLQLAQEAQTLNNLNGRLVAERLSSNQQAIQTLMTAANRPATYGPDGQTNALGRGRTLGSA